MLELIIIFATSFLVLPIVSLANEQNPNAARSIRFWSVVFIVLALAAIIYLIFFGSITVRM